jgi:hypothetical protein
MPMQMPKKGLSAAMYLQQQEFADQLTWSGSVGTCWQMLGVGVTLWPIGGTARASKDRAAMAMHAKHSRFERFDKLALAECCHCGSESANAWKDHDAGRFNVSNSLHVLDGVPSLPDRVPAHCKQITVVSFS